MKSAPPTDANGRTDVSAPGVGAHQRHLTASPRHATGASMPALPSLAAGEPVTPGGG